MDHPGAWHRVWLKRAVGGGQGVVECEATTSDLTIGTTEEGGRGLEDPKGSGRDHGAGVGRKGQDLPSVD